MRGASAQHLLTDLVMLVPYALEFAYELFVQRGGLGKAYQIFGGELPKLLEEMHEQLAA